MIINSMFNNYQYSSLCQHWLKGLFLSWLFAFSTPSFAAQAVATVSKNIVGVNEVFQLTINVDDNVNTNALDLSNLDVHFNYGTPSVSSGTSFVNGVVTRQTEWKIAVAAKEVGEFTIPSFRLGASQTDPIKMTVLKSANKSASSPSKPEIKIDAESNKDQLYVGESFRYTVRIRIGEQMSQAALQAPSGDGLNVRQIGEDRQVETVLNGRRYLIITRDYQITANNAGDILLRGAKFTGNLIKGNRGFGSTLQIPFEQQADDLSLSVLAKPADYKGLWLPTEALELEQQWQPDVQEMEVGEPISRTITLRIKNAEQSSLPNLNLQYPNSVRVYNENPVYGSDNEFTSMTIKQVIIPRQAGEISLPALSINWWNTATSKQETSNIDGLTLSVLPGDPNSQAFLPPQVLQPENAVPTDNNVQTEIIRDSGWWPWLSLCLAILWLTTLILLFIEKYKRKQQPRNLISAQVKQPLSPVEGMIQALDQDQPIQLQSYFQQWLKHSPNHPQHDELHKAIQNVMQCAYSKDKSQKKETIKRDALLIMQELNKTTIRDVNAKSSALEPITPQ
ncbi:BatD family protein [Photobacterium lutimaris]|uniref:Protein BatD n=1 Tax=Photobacterium lutimaris TaxID=388278 RepID=A0A2T3J517_9GAMM|nr:BatD family protein [Photobacterium lutimaris]PSU36388.1 protein BatD [Photobacterium lutimaris]TDR74713.1 oxygen tolerance protein BatD [Photobacterium lutimaris]